LCALDAAVQPQRRLGRLQSVNEVINDLTGQNEIARRDCERGDLEQTMEIEGAEGTRRG
jgi:hypothetical protein